MRVLFSTTAGTGHFGPLIPVAKACAAAGQTVAVAAPNSFAETVTRAGFEHLPFGAPPPELIGEVFGRIGELPYEEANRVVLAEVFGRLDAKAALPALSRMISDWRPDVVVRETCEFGSLVAADRGGIAQLEVAIGMGWIGPELIGVLDESLVDLSIMAGLPPVRGAELLLHGDSFTSVPASLDSGELMLGKPQHEQPVGDRRRLWRFRTRTAAAELTLPAPWGDPSNPLVYVSYGSVTARQPRFAPMYQATLDVLADLPIRVLMTTGRDLDPANLDPIPPNSHVKQWWPQEVVMDASAAVIGHGGFGTTMAALAAGVPQILLPLFSFDQAINAERVASVNAGIQISGGLAAVSDLPAALGRVLDDPAFTEGARAVAGEIAGLPDITECLPILEQLANQRSVSRS
ncbi:MAG TPA: glycosyltransferase [Propionibacteriaceae bacterium]|nr:glycosyltransferase [Propionibacteriaceae bacterium]